nr:thioredoxin [Streptomyces buecherae]
MTGPGDAGTRERDNDERETAMIKAEGVDEVTDATFADEVLTATLPVLVEFTADWCPPCRQIAPVLSAVADEEAGRIRVVQLDVDTSPATTAAYGVLAMPTLMLFRDGEPVASMVGARPKRRLLQELADAL